MTQASPTNTNDLVPESGVRRRDFINVAAVTSAGIAGLATLYPLISQMAPAADVLAAGEPKTFDLGQVAPGQRIVTIWRSMPIFIVNRTPKDLAGLREPALLNHLRDPDSHEAQQPDYAANWSRSIKPEYLVLIGICTHLGCIPEFKPTPGSIGDNLPGGFFCPCHGSKYDMAGRVFKSVPAPYNLPVPPYHFAGANTLTIGENPPGSAFKVTSIGQL
ncbi:ubiquinol-cytochrome c reductase iron-sulfur subunit [Novosphingobium sp. ZN18A2]|uniref:ubiquinol-cytochrome c reductase iron-sulfur subunit n=1 Tax=Novosphingobium sp. ZN18A2 TaxID=3079861 RepID=UPI0030CF376F